MQYAIYHPEQVASLTLSCPIPPYGMCGTKDISGTPCWSEYAASGRGLVNPYFVRFLEQSMGDDPREPDNPSSPRNVMNATYFAASQEKHAGRCLRVGRQGEEPWRDTANRATVHEAVESAQVQYVTTLRHVAGKSYPSPDRCGRAASRTCSRTVFCTSGERARRTGDEDAAVSVT